MSAVRTILSGPSGITEPLTASDLAAVFGVQDAPSRSRHSCRIDRDAGPTVSTLVVRDARVTDDVAIAALCEQLGYPVAPGVMPARLDRLARDANAQVFVAALDTRVVGLETVHVRYTLNHEAPIAQITLLVVDESTRGIGAGRALVEAAERFARDRGAKRIVVTTALHRAGAHAFYERVGYAHTGRRYGKDFVQEEH